jgi:hypothetical protein
MGWQPGRDSWPGEAPGQDGDAEPALLSGFANGGCWATAAPGAELAAALEAAAGPDGHYDGADTGSMVGITRQWAALESHAAAGKLGAVRAVAREDSDGTPRLRRRADLPGGWDDSLNYEVAGALAMGPVPAGNLAVLAWVLGSRLAGTGRLLADGVLTLAKARLVVQVFEPLDAAEAARAEALVLPELGGKTYFQVERLAWRAAVAVAPDVAERRRTTAERARARVTLFREEAGTAGLSGRDLPAAQALSGHANVLARAAGYQGSGLFPGRGSGALQALAYLDLLNDVSVQQRLAFARAAAEPPDDPGPDEPGPGGPAPEDPGPVEPAPSPGDPGPEDLGPGDPGRGDPGPDDPSRGDGGNGGPGGQGPGGPEPGVPPAAPRQPALPEEVAVPLAALLRQAKRAGDNRLLGALDPALARDLAFAAARSPASRWEVTITDDHGYAIGHGPARDRKRRPEPRGASPPGPPHGRPGPPPGSPLRVNITVTAETWAGWPPGNRSPASRPAAGG